MITFVITNISPFFLVLTLGIPLERNLSFSPLCVPAGIVRKTFPYNVGISFLHPRTASVIVSGTSR